MRAGTSLASLLCAGCILRPDPFTCSSADQCVLDQERGICVSGSCAFDDEDCPSGFVFGPHAPLAGECTPTGTGSDAGTTDADATGTQTTENTTQEATDGETTGPADPCLACVYLSPDGDDADAGTRAAPWLTFARAFEAMEPGSVLVLLDGAYPEAIAGRFHARCGTDAPQGAPDVPVTVRADNDRAAIISSSGSGPAVHLEACEHWIVEGVRGIGAFHVSGSVGIEIAGALVSDASTTYRVEASENVLIEGSEAYDFDAVGFAVDGSIDVTLRRCYGNPHGDAEAVFELTATLGARVENCVAEVAEYGFRIRGGEIEGRTAGRDTTIVGSIAVGNRFGIAVRDRSANGTVGETSILHALVLQSTEGGIWSQASSGTQIRNATVVIAPDAIAGVSGSDSLTSCCAPPERCPERSIFCSVHAVNTVSLGGTYGFRINEQDDALVEFCNSAGHGTNNDYRIDGSGSEPIDDAEGAVQNSLRIADGLGLDVCAIAVLRSSPLSGAGAGGEGIGADIRYRFEGSDTPTDEPLWGADLSFPCGALVAGVSDQVGRSCFDLHERIAIGGCGL